MPDNVKALNVFHARNDSGGDITDLDVLDQWGDYLEAIYGEIVARMNENITMTYEIFEVDTVSEETTPIGVITPSTQPSEATAMLPHGCAAQIYASLSGGGKGIGRKYFPGFAENLATQSTWNAATLTALGLAGAEWIATFGGVGSDNWTPVTWTLAKGFRTLTAVTASDLVSYQRRRKPGVGT
jgi:hypothetical protein